MLLTIVAVCNYCQQQFIRIYSCRITHSGHDRLNMVKTAPTYEEALVMLKNEGIRDNILRHSLAVMRIARAIAENVGSDSSIDTNLVIISALLHDITKTRALTTCEPHDITGGALLDSLGFPSVAKIIATHVDMPHFDQNTPLTEAEIVHYADKRVMHDAVVSVEERISDLLVRYGHTEMHRNRIHAKLQFIQSLENKIRKHLTAPLEQVINSVENR